MALVPAHPMKVYCYPVDRGSAYVPLLFDGIQDAYQPIFRQDGSLRNAIDDLDAGELVIVHVHWEEFVLRECRSEVEADAAASAFASELAAVQERGGPIVWTVHNELPHEIPYHRQFFALRAALARYADVVLLHNANSRDVLAKQVAIDPSRLRQLPHPSYLGRLEDEATLEAGLSEVPLDRRIQAFGWIRLQKGYGQMLDMLSADFLDARGAHVRISGSGAEAELVVAQQANRNDVRWDIRHVPDPEVPRLLRSAACVILPYERVLTSGVALLAISVGAMIVAADYPQLRELLPLPSHRYLYRQGDAHAFHRIIDDVLALSPEERRLILETNLAVARELRPRKIARCLATIYREVSAARANGGNHANVFFNA